MKLTTTSILWGFLAFVILPASAQVDEEQDGADALSEFQFFSRSNMTNFESPHVHPLDLSPDGRLLAICNTPEARIEFFDVTEPRPVLAFSVPVGLEPVSVRFRNAEEAWAVAHVSDQINIIDVGKGTVSRILKTGDEPCDVVFAGRPAKAYVSCSQENKIEVFRLDALDDSPRVILLQGEEPRALAVSPDGTQVHASLFESGNGTTVLAGGILKREMITFPPDLISHEEGPYGGENPVPSTYDPRFPIKEILNQTSAPPTGMIVKQHKDGRWLDENGEDWTDYVSGEKAALSGRRPGWRLLDHEIATIETSDYQVRYQGGTMNICMGMAVNPVDGRIAMIGTDALNHIRYEPVLNGIFLRVTLGLFDPATAISASHDLNPHLDYTRATVPLEIRRRSLGDPRGMVWAPDGERAFITGMGSSNLIVVDSHGRRVPNQEPIEVGEGPTGLALNEDGTRLFVLNRFDSSVSVIDTKKMIETARCAFPNTTPEVIKKGRKHLFDTHHSSGLGHVSCGSCHVDARHDRLAWDLGVPDGDHLPVDRNVRILGTEGETSRLQHPMKGPMTTMTLQDIIGKGPFHWRADKAGIEDFNDAFPNLLGREDPLTDEEMEEFKDYLRTIHFPPNPYREDDNSLPTDLPLPGMLTTGRFGAAGEPLPNGNAERGLELFRGRSHPMLQGLTCFACHQQTSGIGPGLLMADNAELGHALSALTGAGQGPFKVPQLRNLYDKTGFDLSADESLNGFGFLHDGSIDTLPRFVAQGMFDVQSVQEVADLVSMLVSFSGNEASSEQRGHWSQQTPSLETHTITGRQEIFNPREVPLGAEATRKRLQPMMKFVEEENSISLIAHGRIDGKPRSWLMWEFEDQETFGIPPGRTLKDLPPQGEGIIDDVKFDADTMNTVHQLKDLLAVVEELTFTVVPQGTDAFLLSIDRDLDGMRNGDETRDLDPLREGHQNPFDPVRSDVTGDFYRMTPDGVIDALNDFDGDGEANIVELDNGTNPLEGWKAGKDRMRPVLTTTATGGRRMISWSSQPKTEYTIEASTDLVEWKPLNSKPIPSGEREDRLHYHIQARHDLSIRYYRIREHQTD